MRLPNLNALRMFDAAARHGSFSSAASELNITQGAVAQQVRGLESALGLTLFHRLPRGLALTERGATYHAAIAEAFQTIDTATQGLSPQPARVTLSVPPSLASKWLIHHLPAFSQDHPGIDLRIIATEHRTDFRSDPVDLAIRIGPPPIEADLEVSLLSPVTLLAVAAPAFAAALSEGPPEQLMDFGTIPLIEDGHAPWARLFMAQRLPSPTRMQHFNQTSLAIDAAINSQGVALVPSLLVAQDLAKGRLITLWQPDQNGMSAYHLIASKSRKATKHRHIVAQWLLARARQPPAT